MTGMNRRQRVGGKLKIAEGRSEETEGIVPKILNLLMVMAAGRSVVATMVIFGQLAQEQETEINGWYPLLGSMFVFAVIPWCVSLFFKGRTRVIVRTVLACLFAGALYLAVGLGLLPAGSYRNP